MPQETISRYRHRQRVQVFSIDPAMVCHWVALLVQVTGLDVHGTRYLEREREREHSCVCVCACVCQTQRQPQVRHHVHSPHPQQWLRLSPVARQRRHCGRCACHCCRRRHRSRSRCSQRRSQTTRGSLGLRTVEGPAHVYACEGRSEGVSEVQTQTQTDRQTDKQTNSTFPPKGETLCRTYLSRRNCSASLMSARGGSRSAGAWLMYTAEHARRCRRGEERRVRVCE